MILLIVVTFTVSVFTICFRKTVNLTIDGKLTKVYTYDNTVSEVLKSKNLKLYAKDKINPALTTNLTKNTNITIKRAVKINVCYEGKSLNVTSSASNIGDMLKEEKLAISDKDEIVPSIDSKITRGMVVKINKYENENVESMTHLAYGTVYKYDNNMGSNQRKTIKKGEEGIKKIITNILYQNGFEISRKILQEAIVKNPVDSIVAIGTLPTVTVSRGGDLMPYTRCFSVRATAYEPRNGASKTYTASGRLAVRNPSGYSTIAVDPRVIPLGTKLYVQNYGLAIAADTGSSIKGNTIDVFFNTLGEANSWAVRYINVYILK